MWNCDGRWIDLDREELERIRWNLMKPTEALAYDASSGSFTSVARYNTIDAATYIAKRKKEDAEHIMSVQKRLSKDIENARKAIEKDWIRQPVNKFFDIKSIEVSVDHRTVVVVWMDGETTKVVRSENDPDDIYMAFTAALAKKLYGSNSAIKRTISKKINEHKPRNKKEG